MNTNVTNLLLAQMLLSSRRPDSASWRQTGQLHSGPAESEHVRTLRERPLGFEHRWPRDEAFEPPSFRMLENCERQRGLMEQQRLIEEQQRQQLYQEGLEQLRKPMEEDRRLWPERQEREREDRLERGKSMIG